MLFPLSPGRCLTEGKLSECGRDPVEGIPAAPASVPLASRSSRRALRSVARILQEPRLPDARGRGSEARRATESRRPRSFSLSPADTFIAILAQIY